MTYIYILPFRFGFVAHPPPFVLSLLFFLFLLHYSLRSSMCNICYDLSREVRPLLSLFSLLANALAIVYYSHSSVVVLSWAYRQDVYFSFCTVQYHFEMIFTRRNLFVI